MARAAEDDQLSKAFDERSPHAAQIAAALACRIAVGHRMLSNPSGLPSATVVATSLFATNAGC